MKKALNFAMLGANVFFLCLFSFGSWLGITEAILEKNNTEAEVFWTVVIEGLYFSGIGFDLALPFIFVFVLFFFLISFLFKKDFSDKYARYNRKILLGFVVFYVSLVLFIYVFYHPFSYYPHY